MFFYSLLPSVNDTGTGQKRNDLHEHLAIYRIVRGGFLGTEESLDEH